MSEHLPEGHVSVTAPYRIGIAPVVAYRGECLASPIGGQPIVRYGESIEDVKRQIDLEIVRQAHAAGLSVVGRTNLKEGGAS